MNPIEKVRPDRRLVIISLLGVYVLWGSTYFAIRVALESLPPFFMAGFRFSVTGALLLIFLKATGSPWPTPKEWRGGAIMGAFLLLVGNGGVVYAEQWVSSSVAALGVGTVPLWTVLFGCIWKRRPTGLELTGVAVGFLGIVLLNFEGDMRANPLGALAIMTAAVSWAFGSAWSRDLTLPTGFMASAVQMTTGGAMLLLLSFLSGETINGMTARSGAALFYLMFFGAFLGFSAYTYLINNVRPALATSYAYVNPLIAVTLGVWAGGEVVSAAGFSAMALIVTAVLLVALGQKRRG